MITSRVFKSGNSQAVRLPKEYRLESNEVSINRIGNILIIVPKGEPWKNFSEGINEIEPDFPSNIRKIKHSERVSLK
jgi:antitoxin VapB